MSVPFRPSLALRWALTGLVGMAAWAVCETACGLLFLGPGVRLWVYHLTPILWAITSPVGWAVVLVVGGFAGGLYLLWEEWAGVTGWRRWLYRGLFMAVSGPITEVPLNGLFVATLGTPLYVYTVLPTFGGSGSLLSPLYYLTMLSGFWFDEHIPGTLAYGRHRRGGPAG